MIILVRHGETEWNAQGRYQGALDSVLTPKGREQAHGVGRRLAAQLGTATMRAYVSPLGRARQTAALIGGHVALSLVIEPRLAEVSLGAWDGFTRPQIAERYPGALAGTGPRDWYFRSPDGESQATALARLGAWLRDAAVPCIAIGHGLAGRLIRGLYLGLGEREMLELPLAPQDGYFTLADGRIAMQGGAP